MSTTDSNLYSQEIWDQGYEGEQFDLPPKDDQVRLWMEKHLPKTAGSVLEVGCFPGRYLAVCGNLGYELNGVDLTPRVDTDMPAWLTKSGYRVGQCSRSDFFAMDENRKFDVVYSNGFIEHFKNWDEVLLKHARLVKPGGVLMITVPNFTGAFQNWFHRVFDRSNYDRHYLPAMDAQKWIETLGKDFEVQVCEYFSEFYFWVGVEKRSFLKKLGFRVFRAMLPLLKVLPKNRYAWSPYVGLVARKRV